MKQLLNIEILVLLLVSVISCGKDNPTSPSSSQSSSPSSSPSANVPFTSTDLRVGSGAEATNGRRVSVNYTGWLYAAGAAENKGTQFDTSVGKAAFAFLLGGGNVIAGWDRGVVGMRVGGQRRLIIPPELGYGANGNGPIPGNSTLVFDIELLLVQ